MSYFYLFIAVTGGQPKDNPPFFCRLILDLAQYFHSASSRKCRQLSPREVTFSLDEREVTWLCFHAFQACLGKKRSRYGEVLRFLRKGLSQLRLPAEDFKIIMDASQHTVFKHIGWKQVLSLCWAGSQLSHEIIRQFIRYLTDQKRVRKVLMKRRRQGSEYPAYTRTCKSVTASVLYKVVQRRRLTRTTAIQNVLLHYGTTLMLHD